MLGARHLSLPAALVVHLAIKKKAIAEQIQVEIQNGYGEERKKKGKN